MKKRIESALKRNAELDAQNIQVIVRGNRVILTGTVTSIAEQLTAECAAWKAAGVDAVENNILITPGLVHFNVA